MLPTIYKTPYLTRFFDAQPRRWFMTFLWTGLFMHRLLDPNAPFIPDADYDFYRFLRDAFYTGVHFASFGLTTILWWWALAGRELWQSALVKSALLWLGMVFVTEWLQTFSPGRYAQLSDIFGDIGGILLAAALILWEGKSRIS